MSVVGPGVGCSPVTNLYRDQLRFGPPLEETVFSLGNGEASSLSVSPFPVPPFDPSQVLSFLHPDKVVLGHPRDSGL